ncbi:MAG: alpha/beta hydrolase fold domain-containing protein [Flavobacterium sp.]
MKKLLFAFILINAGAFAQEKVFKPVVLPEGYTSQLNIVYTGGAGWEQKLDLYLPKTDKPVPVLINIHGGGWNHGEKESQTGFKLFFKLGYAVANIEYRLTPNATAPAAVEDARCAIVYLIQHAKELNIDTSKIVMKGGSAGGHLALMAGLLGNDHRFDTNCKTESTIKVAAIIASDAITNLERNDPADYNVKQYGSAKKWLGRYSEDLQFIRSVSPVQYVAKNSPPVFLVHGDADAVVPYEQALQLNKKLEEAGVKKVFITKKGGGHGIKDTKEVKQHISDEMEKFLRDLNLYSS